MKVRVLYFASAREVAGISSEDLELGDGCNTVADVKVALSQRFALNFDKNRIKIAVNKRYSDDNTVIKENDEIALIPPIAGG